MPLRILCIALAAVILAACTSAPYQPPPSTPGSPPSQTPAPESTPEPQPVPPPPSQPPPKQFRLGAASAALVSQARAQAASGDFSTATTTLERALRIEPDNPLLWIELGRVRQAEGNAAQADNMGRKALSLARGDPNAQASAWRLIAESLRTRGRNQEASDAEQKANALVPR